MKHVVAAIFLCVPTAVFAVGSDDPTPPKPTSTTTECEAPQIWDEATKSCVNAQDSSLNDDQRFEAARELAYAGQLDRAGRVLDTMQVQNTSPVLTYRGFIARKSGDFDLSISLYQAALSLDADNIQARSYLGQGFVDAGDLKNARKQLRQIRQRGGRNTWAEHALRVAIESGRGFAY
ncbi:MAG: tetratricopeptide repeat protein [Pseudomonadota bacterium]